MEQAIAKKYIDKIDVTHIPKTTAVFTNYLNIQASDSLWALYQPFSIRFQKFIIRERYLHNFKAVAKTRSLEETFAVATFLA